MVGACVMGTQGREPVSTSMHQYGSVIQANAGSGEKQEVSQWKGVELYLVVNGSPLKGFSQENNMI